jgi:NTE family protein
MRADLVCEGGGTKIGGLVGGIKALEDAGFEFSNLAGASAGAIVSSLSAAGYTAGDLENLILPLDFKDFLDGNKFLTIYNWFVHQGIYKGDAFYHFMKDRLAEKNVSTFGDLVCHKENGYAETDYKWRWKLKVIVTDVSRNEMVVLPDDAEKYGQNPDEVEVAKAVRMSMSLPYFFRPVKTWDACFIDGGATSNFPIWLFDADKIEEVTHPTIGLLLDGGEYDQHNEITGWWTYLKAILNTMLQAHDRKFISPDDFEHRIIKVPTGDVGTADFNLPRAKKEWLVHSGYDAGREFLNDWTWERYLEWTKKKIESKRGTPASSFNR